MISRKTTKTLAEIYNGKFIISSVLRGARTYRLNKNSLYDFLYENDYDTWFLNSARRLPDHEIVLKDFIMKLHTGETLLKITPNWTKEQRVQLGQRLLRDLSEDILVWSQVTDYTFRKIEDKIRLLKSQLEIDGYIFRDGKLYFSEAAVLDTQDEIGILEKLIQDLELNNQDVIKHHLNLSETHYIDEKWDDSIANSRKFLESTLREISDIHHLSETSQHIDDSIYSKPYLIRNYLESEGIIEPKEKEAISKVYGLLSETGSHPYIAQKDQARLCVI